MGRRQLAGHTTVGGADGRGAQIKLRDQSIQLAVELGGGRFDDLLPQIALLLVAGFGDVKCDQVPMACPPALRAAHQQHAIDAFDKAIDEMLSGGVCGVDAAAIQEQGAVAEGRFPFPEPDEDFQVVGRCGENMGGHLVEVQAQSGDRGGSDVLLANAVDATQLHGRRTSWRCLNPDAGDIVDLAAVGRSHLGLINSGTPVQSPSSVRPDD